MSLCKKIDSFVDARKVKALGDLVRHLGKSPDVPQLRPILWLCLKEDLSEALKCVTLLRAVPQSAEAFPEAVPVSRPGDEGFATSLPR